MNSPLRHKFSVSLLAFGLLAALCADALAQKQVLRVRLDGPMMEAPNDAAGLMSLLKKQQIRTLRYWVETIGKAASDPGIAGMMLIIEQPELSMAQIEELHRSISAFRATGKKVLCYVDFATNGTYALASAADHITLASTSELWITGLYGEMWYFKGLLDKIGVQADMLHCGAWKSALEPYTRTEPSKEAADNLNWLLDGIYGRWVGLIATGRNLPVEDVKKAIDQAPLSAEKALKLKLVDEVSSFAAFADRIHKEFGADVEIVKKYDGRETEQIDFDNPFAIFSMFTSLMKEMQEPTDPGLGLIYIDGGIMVGKSDSDPWSGETIAGSTTIRAAIEKALDDERVRAVVIRVSSPGGSAIASNIIYEAGRRLARKKPLIVSMGGVAGSGGYYVSLPGDVIFAEASTLTASIGVVGGKLVWKELMSDKLGITSTEFTRGANAGWLSPNRPWTDAERTRMSDYMNEVYAQFKDCVTQARGDRLKKPLAELAEGRVFTGEQALEYGLVDKLGGLSDAMKLARSKAGLAENCPVYQFPKASDLEQLLSLLTALSGGDKEDEFEVGLGARLTADPLLSTAIPLLNGVAPAQFREMVRVLRGLFIIQQERVGCFMNLVPGL